MNTHLIELEKQLHISPQTAAVVLGYSVSTYYSYRNNSRPLPLYGQRHVECILGMTPDQKQVALEKWGK